MIKILLLTTIIIASQIVATAYSLAPEQRRVIDSGSLYFNVEESAVCDFGSGTAYIDPGENAQFVWEFFADKIPGHLIAGIIGNMTAESGVQPQRLQGTAGGVITLAENVPPSTSLGWGLVQWTPARKIINTFSPISDANDITNQLNFLWSQLLGEGPVPEGAAWGKIKEATTPAEAAELFGREYERPANLSASLIERITAAEAAYVRFNNLFPTVEAPIDGSGTTASINTNRCVSNESNSSIVSIARQELAKGPIEYDANVFNYTDGNQEAWCADFVSWVYKEAGHAFTGGLSGGWRRPGVRDLQAMFQNEVGYLYFEVGEQLPRPGDVAFYIGSQTPDGGSTEHVNIVVSVNGGVMTTIGGNESNRVMESTRTIELGADSLVGFGRKLE